MEIEVAMRHHCQRVPGIEAHVGSRVWTHRLADDITNTGKRALVIRRGSPWSTPIRGRSMEFPRLIFDCYADRPRDASGRPTEGSNITAALSLARAVMNAMRPLERELGQWVGGYGTNPGFRFSWFSRNGEPLWLDKDSQEDGSYEGIQLQELAVAIVEYAPIIC